MSVTEYFKKGLVALAVAIPTAWAVPTVMSWLQPDKASSASALSACSDASLDASAPSGTRAGQMTMRSIDLPRRLSATELADVERAFALPQKIRATLMADVREHIAMQEDIVGSAYLAKRAGSVGEVEQAMNYQMPDDKKKQIARSVGVSGLTDDLAPAEQIALTARVKTLSDKTAVISGMLDSRFRDYSAFFTRYCQESGDSDKPVCGRFDAFKRRVAAEGCLSTLQK